MHSEEPSGTTLAPAWAVRVAPQIACGHLRDPARVHSAFFKAARERTDPVINAWVDSLKTREASAQQIADEIIKRTTPSGGSQDEAACQQSMAQAMEDLLANDPDVDLLNLDDGDIWELIESFLGYEAFHRMSLDIGQVFESSSLSPRDSITRMKEMRDYLKAELSARVEALRSGASHATPSQLQSILQSALKNTFAVYEGSI